MSTASRSRNPCILLFGPTAVGKTELIDRLFSQGFEIVSADALQVYRGLDIGTAKPPPSERERIPHHLIDIREPDQRFSVGDFVREADRAVEDIRRRGKLPLISGGTAFYLIRFLYGLPETPPASPDVRAELEQRLECEGRRSLYEELGRVDPVYRGRIHENDTYRILRALEVYHGTGRPLSGYRVPDTPRPTLDPLVLGLYREREDLYGRIDARVDAMWQRGLVEELRRLIGEGCGEETPAMKGIGYREFFRMRRLGEPTLAEVREQIRGNSRRYAKRQMTFFRRIGEARWFRPSETGNILEEVESFLAGHGL